MPRTGLASALAVALLPAACAAPPALDSAACVPKPLATLPVTARSGHPAVEVTLDGQPVTMILDLGAQATVLADATADRLHLARAPSALPTITGIGGSGMRWAATARRLTMGGLTLDDQRMEVAQMRGGDPKQAVDGVLGLDVLLNYDIDWDLPNKRVTFNTPSGCGGPPAGWASPATEAPLRHPRGLAAYGKQSKLLLLPVAVDDRPVSALLDTGAAFSMINSDLAAALEPGRDGDRKIRMAGIGAGSPAGTVHRFRAVPVAGRTFANVPLVIGPVPTGIGDMILGVGYMAHHRAWLPAGGDAIWFGPAVAPLPAGPPLQSASPSS